jgi:hypothetical protein
MGFFAGGFDTARMEEASPGWYEIAMQFESGWLAF